MPRVYLLLGSNLGRRERYLALARQAIRRWPKTKVLRESLIFLTPAEGHARQPSFLNQVLCVRTDLTPVALLLWVKIVERQLGRKRRFHWGPREIDIDILFYGRSVVRRPFLTIPHKELPRRASMLACLRDLAPRIKHPRLKKTVAALWQALPAAKTRGIHSLMAL